MRRARGQAAIELAVTLTLFVTVLLGTLFLSETGYLALKVQEAASAALWSATDHRTHGFDERKLDEPPALYEPLSAALSGSESIARSTQARYADYDGRSSHQGSAPHRLFATAAPLTVSCSASDAAPRLAIPARTAFVDADGAGVVPLEINRLLGGWYQSHAVTCTAQGSVLAAAGVPGLSERRIPLCGVGRAVNGRCEGGYALLMGTWSIDGPRRAKQNALSALSALEVKRTRGWDSNWPYREMVRQLFELSGRTYGVDQPQVEGAASRFAVALGGLGKPPYDEKTFSMSYTGVELGYLDGLKLDSGNCRSCHFNTTGNSNVTTSEMLQGYTRTGPWTGEQSWDLLRKPCFLGLGGCSF